MTFEYLSPSASYSSSRSTTKPRATCASLTPPEYVSITRTGGFAGTSQYVADVDTSRLSPDAALDVGVAAFPKPKQILLAGSSAGGLGTIYAAGLVRLLYPDAKLFVFNDSGVGVSTPDGVRAKLTRDEWGTQQLIPASCPECLTSPH